MIKCPNCSAELEFDASTQLVTCEYCKSTFDPNELSVKVSSATEDNTIEGKSYTCSQCGASLITFEETAITFCSYCGSQAMIESKMMKMNNPDYIIPFKKTKEECIKSYKKILSKSIFAPQYMKSDIVVSKFRGIYMPYCVYKLSHHGITSNTGKKYKYRRGDYVYYDDYKITSEVNTDYEGLSYDLISNFYDRFSGAIPYNFNEAQKFNPYYLSGFYADTGDVDNEIYVKDATKLVEFDACLKLSKLKEYRKYGCSNPKVKLDSVEKKTAMYPVYFLAIRTKDNKHINYAVINGQTGEAVADIPVDFKRYIIFSLIVAIPIFLLINWKMVITPKGVCGISIIISLISMIISISQIIAINNRRNHTDDLGYKKKIDKKNVVKTKVFKHIYKTIIAGLIGLFVIGVDFVQDYYYYGASIIIFILIIFSFYDLVKLHNELVSNKLPQLEKRGGEEDA